MDTLKLSYNTAKKAEQIKKAKKAWEVQAKIVEGNLLRLDLLEEVYKLLTNQESKLDNMEPL